jgi:cytochrome c oxidase subunit II
VSSFFPVAASSQGAGINGTMVAVYSLMGALLLGWAIYLAWVIVEPRIRPASQPQPAAARPVVAFTTTGFVFAIEAILVVTVALPMWRARMTAPPISPGAIAVRVLAERYVWHFGYPGPDGRFDTTDDIVTTELHVPVGRQVVAQLTSKDVIHTFGVAGLRVKQDVIPGIVASVWFTPKAIGQFDIACSGLCGPGHDQMRGKVVVESATDFTAFLAREATAK